MRVCILIGSVLRWKRQIVNSKSSSINSKSNIFSILYVSVDIVACYSSDAEAYGVTVILRNQL